MVNISLEIAQEVFDYLHRHNKPLAKKFWDAIGGQKPVELYTGEWPSDKSARFKKTGEFRAPKAGEFYLSGAIPTAYRAPNDLSQDFWILIKVETYQPKTGQPCTCKRGQQRDNCPECEGTGQRIDFKAIRNRGKA